MMNRFVSVVFGLCALILASGCATTQQVVPLPDQARAISDPGKSRIYVFRPESMLGGRARMKVKDSERVIGDLGMNSFLCWERDPGMVTVFLDFYATDDVVVNMREDLDAQPGAVYYLRAGLLETLPFSNNPNKLDRLWRVDEAEGKRLLKECKPPAGTP